MTIQLQIKLASIAVHADELLSPNGHTFDKHALEGLLQDPEVRAYLADMERQCFLPLRRDGVRYSKADNGGRE